MSEYVKLIIRSAALVVLSFGGGYIAKISETNKTVLFPFILIMVAIGFIYMMIVFDNDLGE